MFYINYFLQVHDLTYIIVQNLSPFWRFVVSRNIILSVNNNLVTSVMCKKYLCRLILHWKNNTYLLLFLFSKDCFILFSFTSHIRFSQFLFCSFSKYVHLFVSFPKCNNRCRIFSYRRIFNPKWYTNFLLKIPEFKDNKIIKKIINLYFFLLCTIDSSHARTNTPICQ